MFCPSCGDEFRPGFTECPDCHVALVEELPEEDTDEDTEEIEGQAEAEGDAERIAEPGEASADQEAPPPKVRRDIQRPDPSEYDPEAERYMKLIPAGVKILDFLDANVRETEVLALSIGDEALGKPYAPGKWTGKELLVHVSDDERIYAYRALRFARGDSTELPGFEEKGYATASKANGRRLEDILRELVAVREATIELFDGLDDGALLRSGNANKHVMSVRAAAYHIAGHELHHANILRERYP